jgi:hypothetical protein
VQVIRKLILCPRFEISECDGEAAGSRGVYLAFHLNTNHEDIYSGHVEGKVLLSAPQCLVIEELIKSVKIGILPEFASGLDGTTTTITIEHGSNSIQLKWWQNAPKEWKAVEKLVEHLRGLAREEIAKSGRRIE